MSKAIVKKEEAQLPVVSNEELVNDWGVQTSPSSDMLVPKILPMQGLSQFVVARKAQMGDFVDSLTGKKLGDIDTPVGIIPFFCQKMWDVQAQQADGGFKYDGTFPVVENPIDPNYNDNLKWQEEGLDREGKKCMLKRIRRMNFFCLLDGQADGMPYVISFKSTSYREGRKLWTAMYVRNVSAKIPPAAFAYNLGGALQTNAKGAYIIPSVQETRRTTPAELTACLKWIKLINKGAVKVDASDDQQVEEVSDDTAEF